MKSHISSLTSHSAAIVVGIRPCLSGKKAAPRSTRILRHIQMISFQPRCAAQSVPSRVSKIDRRDGHAFSRPLIVLIVVVIGAAEQRLAELLIAVARVSLHLLDTAIRAVRATSLCSPQFCRGRLLDKLCHELSPSSAICADRVYRQRRASRPSTARKVGGSGNAFITAHSLAAVPSSSAAAR